MFFACSVDGKSCISRANASDCGLETSLAIAVQSDMPVRRTLIRKRIV